MIYSLVSLSDISSVLAWWHWEWSWACRISKGFYWLIPEKEYGYCLEFQYRRNAFHIEILGKSV